MLQYLIIASIINGVFQYYLLTKYCDTQFYNTHNMTIYEIYREIDAFY